MVLTQFKKKIKKFRSNNAKELQYKYLFAANGIIHQAYCVAIPQQNSVVERKHHNFLNVTRALQFQSKIPIILWSECILSVAYLFNWFPSKLLNNKKTLPTSF